MLSEEIVKILKFIIVGLVNTCLDLGIFWTLLGVFLRLNFFKTFKIKPATLSHSLSFLITNTISYQLNSKFTFSNSTANRGFAPFLAVSTVSFLVSVFLIQYFNKDKYFIWSQNFVKSFKLKLEYKKYALVVKLGVIGVTMVINYLGYRLLVF